MRNVTLTFILALLFVGCDNGLVNADQIETYDFNIETGLDIDQNGYLHFPMSEYSNGQSEQSIVRFTAYTNNPEIQFVWWDSNGYWEYMMNGEEFLVPIINHSSYTNAFGEANTMFGPNVSMEGDTVMVSVGYVDSIYDVEYVEQLFIILD